MERGARISKEDARYPRRGKSLLDGNNQFAETAQYAVYVANLFLDMQSPYLRRQSPENGCHFKPG